MVKTVYKLLGVKSIRTSVYNPTTNNQCERTNRSIISILRKFVCDNPFQPRAIRGSYNPRYYNIGVERGYNRNNSKNGGFQKLHTTSCIINTCSGNKRRNNKSMHSYSVMCDKNHRYNSIRGRNICDEVYK